MVNEERKKSIGRTQIWNKDRTTSFSRRALKGNLEIVDFHCPKCHHHKALVNAMWKKCSRCGYRVRI